MIKLLLAIYKRTRTQIYILRTRKILTYGKGLHIGSKVRLWAPQYIKFGMNLYLGHEVSIECNCVIGDNCLVANRVAFVGRNDHDYKSIGIPVRFSPWIGGGSDNRENEQKNVVNVGDDVWIGYGAIILTGVSIGKGTIVATGSVVTSDTPDYSIVGGVPAKVLGRRFSDEEIMRHEQAIVNGRFEFSEQGCNHWIVEPYKDRNNY